MTFLSSRKTLTALGLVLLLNSPVKADNCQISVSPGDISFGRIKKEESVTSRNNIHRFQRKEAIVSVFCQHETQAAIFVNSLSGEHGGILFGDRSRLAVTVDSLSVDGYPADIAKTKDRENFTQQTSRIEKIVVLNNEGFYAIKDAKPMKGKQFMAKLIVTPLISDAQFRSVRDNTLLESHLEFEIITR